MTEILPEFALLNTPILYNDAVERSEIINIACSQTTQQTLNRGASQLIFRFNGDVLYRLSSPKTGLRIKLEFRTRANNANDRNAISTLASNFIGHCFSKASLRIGGCEVEAINNPGVVMDTLYHCEESEFRDKAGSRLGFVPDTADTVSTTIGTRQGDVAGADVAATIVSVNAAASRRVEYNTGFNKGFAKRMKLYNYTVAGDDDFRHLDIFIPLNRIFGFCSEFDRVLKYVNFEVELTRTNNSQNCIYGAANTTLNFGQAQNNDGGITEMTLELERITFKPTIMEDMEEKFSKPIEATYLRRICGDNFDIGTNRTGTFQHTADKGLEGLPRFVFCIFKNRADDTVTNNFQRCSHANIQTITVDYASQTYPNREQDCDFLNNEYSRFYDDFCDVCRSLGFNNPALSYEEFRDMYTIFALDLSAQPAVYESKQLTIKFRRREVPAVGAATAQNPREIRGFFVILSESRIEIDCANRVVRKK